jgi:hypothetical protein
MFDSFAASPSSDPIRRRFEKEQTTAPSELYCIVYCIPRIPTLPILLDNQSLGYLICRILLLPKKLRTVYICRGGVEEKRKEVGFVLSPRPAPPPSLRLGGQVGQMAGRDDDLYSDGQGLLPPSFSKLA